MYSYKPEDQSGHKGIATTFEDLEEAKLFAKNRAAQYPVFAITDETSGDVVFTEEDVEHEPGAAHDAMFHRNAEDRQGFNYSDGAKE